MITAIDTNVLLDVLGADATHGRSSLDALRRCAQEGQLVVCEVVWIETAVWFDRPTDCRERFADLGIDLVPMNDRAAEQAAVAWAGHRRAGGAKDRIAADFMVGAHAQLQAERLLTRDRGFYRHCFTGLTVLDPRSSGAR